MIPCSLRVILALLASMVLCGCQLSGDGTSINGIRDVGYNVKPLYIFPPVCAGLQGSTPQNVSRTFEVSFPSTERMGIRLVTRTERDRPHSNESAMEWEVHLRDSSGATLRHWRSRATDCREEVPQKKIVQSDGKYVPVLAARLWWFPDGEDYIVFEPGNYTVELTMHSDLQDQRAGTPCVEVAIVGRWYWPWP